MITGAAYGQARLDLGMSRSRVAAMGKRAGHALSEAKLKRLEVEGSDVADGRGFPAPLLSWLDYLYGLTDRATNWSAVERGAPVLVVGEKASCCFHQFEDGVVTIWGGPRNHESFRTLPTTGVRLIAPTAVPPPETANLYAAHTRGIDAAFAARIVEWMGEHPGAQSVGSLAYTLGIDNEAVSRVAAMLTRRGRLRKIQRGVFVLVEPEADVEAVSVKTALAERVMAPTVAS